MDVRFLTAVDIAKLLKVSRALAYRLIAQGEISSVRFGRTVRVRQTDLDDFVQRHATNGATENVPILQSLLTGKCVTEDREERAE